MRVLVLVGAIGGMGACTLLTRLDDLRGDASSPSDAASPFDMGVAMDAPMMEAAAGPFCKTQDARFCDDFDDSDASNFPMWSSSTELRGGRVTRVSSDASPPFAVAFGVGSWDGGGPQVVLTKLFFDSAKSALHYAFDLRIEKVPSPGAARFNCSPVRPLGDSSGGQLQISIGSNGSVLEEAIPIGDGGFQYAPHTLSKNFVLDTWTHVDIDMTLGSPPTAQVKLDGMVVMKSNIDPRIVVTTPSIQAGISYLNPTGDGVALTIDNVVFDFY